MSITREKMLTAAIARSTLIAAFMPSFRKSIVNALQPAPWIKRPIGTVGEDEYSVAPKKAARNILPEQR